MKTELITSWRIQPMVGKMKQDMVIVTTLSEQTVWVNKSQFDTNAEQITYKVMLAGSTYKQKDGKDGILKVDRNEFLGCGKQTIKKYSTVELMDHLILKGITPQFSL